MANISVEQMQKAYDLLSLYDGVNPYLIGLKNSIYVYKKEKLNDFQAEFILKNINYEPKFIDKIVILADWYAEKKKEDWGLDFLPLKLYVGHIIGETDTAYAMYVKYRRSQDKMVLAFINKKGLITELFQEDYTKLEIDFDKYDNLSKDKNIKIRDFQKTAVQFLVTRKKAILADSQGYGKTLETIISALESGAKKILIICPASLKSNWRNELLNYVDESEIEIIYGSKWKDNRFTIANFDILDNFYTIPQEIAYEVVKDVDKHNNIIEKRQIKWQKKPIYDEYGKIIQEGIPKMKTSQNKKLIEKAMEESQLYNSNFDLVIIDEVHKLCNSTSGRYKIIFDFLTRTKPSNIFLLSGTPISNRPINFYNVLKLIDAPITRDWLFYVKRYCEAQVIYLKGEKWKWTQVFLQKINKQWGELNQVEFSMLDNFLLKNARHVWKTDGASYLEELKEKTKHLYLRRLTSDIKGMVKKNVEVIRYDLDNKQREEYNELWDDYVAKRDDEDKETMNLYKQVIEGSLLRQFLADEMVENTIELAESILEDNKKLVIMCSFDNEIDKLKKYFGKRAVVYNGKLTPKKKDEAEHKFKTDDSVEVFLGNIAAASVGLNLHVANNLIFNSIDWVAGSNQQGEDRVFRLVQKKDCFIYYQIFRNTFLEDMYDLVMAKDRVINDIIKKEEEK